MLNDNNMVRDNNMVCIPIHQEVQILQCFNDHYDGEIEEILKEAMDQLYVDSRLLMPIELLLPNICNTTDQYETISSILLKIIDRIESTSTRLVLSNKFKVNPLNGMLYMEEITTSPFSGPGITQMGRNILG